MKAQRSPASDIPVQSLLVQDTTIRLKTQEDPRECVVEEIALDTIIGTWLNDNDAPTVVVIYFGKSLELIQHQVEVLEGCIPINNQARVMSLRSAFISEALSCAAETMLLSPNTAKI